MSKVLSCDWESAEYLVIDMCMETQNGPKFFTRVENTGSDEYAVVSSDEKITSEEAQKIWNNVLESQQNEN